MPAVKFDSIARFMPSTTHFDQAEKDEIASMFKTQSLNKNENLLIRGCHVYTIACVTRGILYRYNSDKNGKLHIDQFICNDQFFTECKCYKNSLPSCFNVIAATYCEILTISTANMEALRKANPKYDRLIHEIISNVMQGRKDMDEMFLQGSKAERVIWFNNYYKQWLPYIKKELIATYLQMSRSEYYLILNL